MGNVKIDTNTQYFLVLGMIIMLAFAGFAAYKPVAVNVDPVDSDAIAQAVIGAIVLPSDNASKTNYKLDEIYSKVFEEDNFKADVKELSISELEDRDYRSLARDLGIDVDDIRKVTVKDIEVTIIDIDDGDATVYIDFRVIYEGDIEVDLNLAKYITATVIIEDNEVDDISFDETA